MVISNETSSKIELLLKKLSFSNAEKLLQAISKLPEKEKNVLTMHLGLTDGNPLKNKDIASKIGKSSQYVSKYLYYSTLKLNKILNSESKLDIFMKNFPNNTLDQLLDSIKLLSKKERTVITMSLT